jgi:hypothetical protein
MNPPEDQPAETPDLTERDALPSKELKALWKQFHAVAAVAPEHARLRDFMGNWELDGTFDMCGYGPNFHAKGLMTSQLIFDGRFLQIRWEIKSQLANWELAIMVGYDTVIQKYVLTLIESLHNGIMIGEGDWYPADSSIRFWGEISNPMFKTRHDCQAIFRVMDEEEFVFEMHVPDREGKFIESAHLIMRRPVGNN